MLKKVIVIWNGYYLIILLFISSLICYLLETYFVIVYDSTHVFMYLLYNMKMKINI